MTKMNAEEKLKKLAQFLENERERQQQNLADVSEELQRQKTTEYTAEHVRSLRRFSATLARITTYSDILEILKLI